MSPEVGFCFLGTSRVVEEEEADCCGLDCEEDVDGVDEGEEEWDDEDLVVGLAVVVVVVEGGLEGMVVVVDLGVLWGLLDVRVEVGLWCCLLVVVVAVFVVCGASEEVATEGVTLEKYKKWSVGITNSRSLI